MNIKEGPERRLGGVPASVMLPDALADLVDNEMRRRNLPSRSAMIRACIEHYFTPSDTTHRDYQLEECQIELKEKTVKLEYITEELDLRYEAIKKWREAFESADKKNDRLLGILEIGAQYTQDTNRKILPAAEAVLGVTGQTDSEKKQLPEYIAKPKRYREFWYQIWLPKRPGEKRF